MAQLLVLLRWLKQHRAGKRGLPTMPVAFSSPVAKPLNDGYRIGNLVVNVIVGGFKRGKRCDSPLIS
nr:hypothetical protein [candidate division Zixibacteria bacterium]